MAECQEGGETKDKKHCSEMGTAHSSARLCQECGLCCNGALFSYVNVSEREAETLKAISIETYINKKGRPAFGLPCNALSGTSCSIYDARPRVCRTYLCGLTRNVLNGGAALEEALDHVEDMKARSRWLHANVPPDMLKTDVQGASKEAPSESGALAAWKNKVAELKRSEETKRQEPPKALWLLLSRLHNRFAEKQERSELTVEDKNYIVKAFGYAKICDRLFEKTSLLGKYGSLVQGL